MSLIEAQKGLTNLLNFNDDCGHDFGKYSWSQGDAEVTIKVPLPLNTTSKMLAVSIETNSLSIGFKNSTSDVIFKGKLFKPIKAEDSTWCIEDKKLLVVILYKSNRQFEEWWPHVVDSEPQCDFKTLKPPSKHMRELDQGAQAQIQKMMFDQEQKRKGMPASDELLQQEMMKKYATKAQQQQQQQQQQQE